MPKPVKKPARRAKTPPKRPTDPNRAAHNQINEHLARMAGPMPDDFGTQLSTYMSELGRRGGRASGAKRMQNLNPKQRSEIAFKAAMARGDKKCKP
jgi:hypothetical protein